MPTATGCSCQRPGCRSVGKHPRQRGGAHAATRNLGRIEALWGRWPDANVGLATGELVVLDIDGPAGAAALAALECDYDSLPITATVITGRGRHLYFRAAGHAIGNGRLGLGLDVRGRDGYAVAPPSRHANGHTYRWQRITPVGELPEWLAAAVGRPAPARRPIPATISAGGARGERYVRRALEDELRQVAGAAPGTRNTTLNRAAFRLGQLAGAGLTSVDALVAPLLNAARGRTARPRSARDDQQRSARRACATARAGSVSTLRGARPPTRTGRRNRFARVAGGARPSESRPAPGPARCTWSPAARGSTRSPGVLDPPDRHPPSDTNAPARWPARMAHQ